MKTTRQRTLGRRGPIVIAVLFLGCAPGPLDIAGLAPKSPPRPDANFLPDALPDVPPDAPPDVPPDAPPDAPPNPLLIGMVAHWPLNDGSGTTAADRSGHGHNGIVTFGPGAGRWLTGADRHFGGGFHFDIGDQIAVGPSFPQATGSSWSVSLWVRPPAGDFGTSYLTLISTENVFNGGWEMNLRLNLSATPPGTFYQFGYYFGPGPPQLTDYYSYDCQCVSPQWTHIVGVVDNAKGTLAMYHDGIALPPSNVPQPIRMGSDTLYIGRWPNFQGSAAFRYFTGDLDDIVIFDRVLTADDVMNLFLAPAPDPR